MTDQQRTPGPGPYAHAAPAYWAAGWRGILPLPARSKKPVPIGYTGRDGTWPSYPDLQAWTDERADANIALRLPPNVLGIDVDHYDSKPGGAVLAQLEAELGPLPPTWRTTSRDDGVSGIRLYRIPEGLRWPGILGAGIETIRYDHRYAVTWPSVHPNGGTYRWITPDGATSLGGGPDGAGLPHVDDLPDLPDTWVTHLTRGELATDQPRADLDDTTAQTWLDQRGGQPGGLQPCRHMANAARRAITDLSPAAGASSRHDVALAGTNRLIWLTGEGHVGGAAALAQLRGAFLTAVGNDRDPAEADAEWARMVSGAVRLAAAAHPVAGPDPCDTFGGLIVAPTAPATSSTTAPEEPCPTPASTSTSSVPSPSTNETTSSPTSTTSSSSTNSSSEEPETQPPAAPAERASWARTDLTAYLDGTHQPTIPTLFPRDDGICLVYPGLTHSFHGESESGKSLVMQHETARLITAGHDVLYIDFESDAPAIAERMLLLGATPTAILEHLDYRRPEVNPQTTAAELDAWTGMLAGTYTLAVIDGVTDSLGTFGLSTKDNDEVARWMRLLPRQIADRTGAAVVLIDHVTKDAENRGRFAIGGQAKMGALTGAAYTVEIAEPLGRGLKGVIVLRVGKDRPGYVRGNSAPMRADRTQETARIIVDSTTSNGNGGTRPVVTVEARSGADVPKGDRKPFRLTGLMEKVSKVLEAADQALSLRELRRLVGGNNASIDNAISTLLQDGHLTISAGPRGASMHELTKAYRQRRDPLSDLYDPLAAELYADTHPSDPAAETSDSDPSDSDRARPCPTVPDRASGTVKTDRAPGPPPYGGRAQSDADQTQTTVPTSEDPRTDRYTERVVAGLRVRVNLDTGEVEEL